MIEQGFIEGLDAAPEDADKRLVARSDDHNAGLGASAHCSSPGVIRWFDGNEAIANPTTRRGARIVATRLPGTPRMRNNRP
jgi:hypothetical protein